MRLEDDSFKVNRTVADLVALLSSELSKRDGRVMFSLVKGDSEMAFRCWEGPFYCVMPTHFDSCGKNLLFGCRGSWYEMEQFINAAVFLKDYCKWKMADQIKEGTYHTIWVGLACSDLK